MKIAIVGGGINGTTLAWLLSDLADVTLYEKKDKLGGSFGGLEIINEGGRLSLERGHQLFYPYYQKRIAALFEYLGIYTEPHSYSYHSAGAVAFSLKSLPVAGLSFDSWSPLANKRIKNDLREFYKSWQTNYKQGNIPINLSLRQYTSGLYIRASSGKDAIYPMVAALWNYPIQDVIYLSANKFIKFINESKLLEPEVRDAVRYIPEGTDKYLSKLLFKGSFTYHLNKPVCKIKVSDSMVHITDEQRGRRSYDKVIVACGKENALDILDTSINSWRSLLDKLQQVKMPVSIHRDRSLLKNHPKLAKTTMTTAIHYTNTTQDTAYHYDLSHIYKLSAAKSVTSSQQTYIPYIMSINHKEKLKNVIYQGEIRRPDLGSITQRSYKEGSKLQGTAGIYYCNDGFNYNTSPFMGKINAALDIAEQLGVELPF